MKPIGMVEINSKALGLLTFKIDKADSGTYISVAAQKTANIVIKLMPYEYDKGYIRLEKALELLYMRTCEYEFDSAMGLHSMYDYMKADKDLLTAIIHDKCVKNSLYGKYLFLGNE